MRSKNYTVAYQEFKTAVSYLPDAVVSGRAHDDAAEGVCKSGTVLAEARIAQGDYAGAEAILNEIITRYDPNCRKASELLAHMRQPGYFNKSLDAGFINKVEEVKRLLAEADGFYQSGQYDKAMKRYDQVLTLDPYNTAARRGQERISNTKYQYGEEAYNETRARDLWKVEEAWQQPVRKYGAVGPVADNKGRGGEVRGTAQMTNKMNSIIIPHVEFRDTTIREAIDFLREQAAESDPSGQGVNIVLRLAPLGQIAPPSVASCAAAGGHRHSGGRRARASSAANAHLPRVLLGDRRGSRPSRLYQARLARASPSRSIIFHLAKRCGTWPIRRD